MFPRLKNSWGALLLSLLAAEAGATQLIEHADRGHVSVNISASETNRLAIEGRRIAHVVPSVKGVLAGQKDEAQGAYYFTLANAAPNQGSVTLFVSDDKGVTYERVDVDGDHATRAWLREATGQSTVPQVFIDGRSYGGYTDIAALDRRGELDELLAAR